MQVTMVLWIPGWLPVAVNNVDMSPHAPCRLGSTVKERTPTHWPAVEPKGKISDANVDVTDNIHRDSFNCCLMRGLITLWESLCLETAEWKLNPLQRCDWLGGGCCALQGCCSRAILPGPLCQVSPSSVLTELLRDISDQPLDSTLAGSAAWLKSSGHRSDLGLNTTNSWYWNKGLEARVDRASSSFSSRCPPQKQVGEEDPTSMPWTILFQLKAYASCPCLTEGGRILH